MNSNYGGALSLFEVGKVLVKFTNFTRIPSSTPNLTNLTLSSFNKSELSLLDNFINSTLLTKMVDSLTRYRGMIDLQFVQNTMQKVNFTFNGTLIQPYTSKYF